jgi:hypothetical protein
MNTSIDRKALHALVDALPAAELPAARRFLEFLRRNPAAALSSDSRRTVEFLPADTEGLFALDWAER